ncbi:glutamate-5-semialdehyde dehydrogenase [Ancylomarina longa]|uniref:Gamma-glutamyl phosphate reductase n=1 Tax=Ancylomarina longa TaxID=2487017 RepID=A0A434AYZ7_9BACT|nr:glutamate-5-semialdehyde dehydrogenase [Ancylomarina longa]RUT79843.1 glutamate-5-semialdehyde dehydrogenase [Ancylomarina longa]
MKKQYKDQLNKVKEAARNLSSIHQDTINNTLMALAGVVRSSSREILTANKKDLDKMSIYDPKYDRLLLSEERIEGIASDIENVVQLPSPLGKILSEKSLDNGLGIKKLSVPLGTIGIIYEARPNVTLDVFALCFKSGNACVLKGGSDADNSNRFLVSIIQETLKQNAINPDIIQLLPAEREAATALMNAQGFVDVLIPRGSQNLIKTVRENSSIPVIETGAGIVHTYFDKYADLEKGKRIVYNAKTRRVSVCNALDCLIIHQDRINDLAEIVRRLQDKKVEIYADQPAFDAIQGKYPQPLLHRATEESYGTEFLSHKLAIKTADHFQDALNHIYQYSSKHSEAIISENKNRVNRFCTQVDAAAVYANTSTAFTDGAQFGLGAEIGISTQKLHARGPMALEALTSYKWVIRSEGKIRD